MSLLFAVILFLFAYGCGASLWRLLDRSGAVARAIGPLPGRLLATLLGASAVGTVTMPLAALGLGKLPRAVLIGVVLSGAAWGAWCFWRDRRLWLPAGRWSVSWADGVGACGFLAATLLTLFFAWRPTLTVDDWMYHYTVPRQWLIQGTVPDVPYEIHAHFYLLAESWSLWGLVLAPRDFLLTKLTQVFAAVAGGLLIAWLGRRHLGIGIGWFAGTWWLLMRKTIEHSASNYIDVAHAALVIGAYAVLSSAVRLPDWKERRPLLVLGGLFLGFAVSTKVSALTVAVATTIAYGIAVLHRREFGLRAIGAQVALIAAPALLVTLPWMIKNRLFAWNPFYPFLMDKFGARPELRQVALDFMAYYNNFEILEWSADGLANFFPYWHAFLNNVWHLDQNRIVMLFAAAIPLWLLPGSRDTWQARPMPGEMLRRDPALAFLAVLSLAFWVPSFLTPTPRFILGSVALLVLIAFGVIARFVLTRRWGREILWVLAIPLFVYQMIAAFHWSHPAIPGRDVVAPGLWPTQRRMWDRYYAVAFPHMELLPDLNARVEESGGKLLLTENWEIALFLDVPIVQNPHMHNKTILRIWAEDEGLSADVIAEELRALDVTYLMTLPPPFDGRHGVSTAEAWSKGRTRAELMEDPEAEALGEIRARWLEPVVQGQYAWLWRLRQEPLAP
ncbi:MAG: hypothetical protein RLY93_19385 [Sumerlaeia bacterium]